MTLGRHGRAGLIALACHILAAPVALAAGPDFADRRDHAFADRGFIATRDDPKITAADGRVVWDLSAYDFLKGAHPAQVNPSLWRQAELLSRHGLFQVTEGVWQVRGFDISNITFIAGRTGWIVIDPLTTVEVARAALDLANAKLGTRPVTAVIYTHSHADHFGGARGVVDAKALAEGRVQVIAPAGFLEHAVSENIIAGGAMSRRAAYQFGTFLPKGVTGQVSAGIGQGISAGTQSLIPPTLEITRTGETLTVDGVRMEFQMTPGTEAPAEMNIYLPDLRTLCMAENANATMHNVLTPRGALVRDAKVWADGLTESIRLYGGRSDLMFASHAWPRFGQAEIVDYLGKHRDAYKYLHDQSVRLMNSGLTGDEIASRLKLPEALDREWYNRGYYGTLSFNSRAVYQRYMGWYDANPASLAAFEPADEARRTVALMGGPKRVLAAARRALRDGDAAWAANLANRLVMADRDNAEARAFLASVYDQLGFAAESAIWRNMYLAGAAELRGGVATARGGAAQGALDLVRNTPSPMLLDLMAVRLNADKAGAGAAVVDLIFPDRDEHFRASVRNGVLIHEARPGAGTPEASLTLPRSAFLALTLGGGDLAALVRAGQAKVTGDPAAFTRLMSWIEAPPGNFPIVWR